MCSALREFIAEISREDVMDAMVLPLWPSTFLSLSFFVFFLLVLESLALGIDDDEDLRCFSSGFFPLPESSVGATHSLVASTLALDVLRFLFGCEELVGRPVTGSRFSFSSVGERRFEAETGRPLSSLVTSLRVVEDEVTGDLRTISAGASWKTAKLRIDMTEEDRM